MNDLLREVLERLERLVWCDTQNPPQSQAGVDDVFDVVREDLRGLVGYEWHDDGGRSYLLAERGAPKVIFNVHLDTVPFGEGWTHDPRRLVVENGRAIGRGACDVKGAAACLLTAAKRTRGDFAILFSTEEEAGSSKPVRAFLAANPGYLGAVIAEPTNNRAVLEHRGIMTALAKFSGTPGHASDRRALQDSAVHEAIRWGAKALELAQNEESRTFGSLSGIRFNAGVVEGGTKANMIAGAASVRFGCRPLPNQSPHQVFEAFAGLADPKRSSFELGFVATPLRAPAGKAEAPRALAAELGLRAGEPVDFWTEAALFSEAGIPALVYGPGDIQQAHTRDEWVSLESLREAVETYARLFTPA